MAGYHKEFDDNGDGKVCWIEVWDKLENQRALGAAPSETIVGIEEN